MDTLRNHPIILARVNVVGPRRYDRRGKTFDSEQDALVIAKQHEVVIGLVVLLATIIDATNARFSSARQAGETNPPESQGKTDSAFEHK